MTIAELRAAGLTVEEGGAVVVRSVDLHVRAGEVVGVTGPSGSGKTSLLYALAGLTGAEGELLIDDRPLVLWRDASVGLIFQNLCLVPFLSTEETVGLPLQAKRIPKGEVAEASAAALAKLGLTDQAAQLVSDLSGGQRQRVAVARALVGGPDVILADEPTSALDPHWRQVVLELLIDAARQGAIVIVASSDAEVTGLCDRLVTLN